MNENHIAQLKHALERLLAMAETLNGFNSAGYKGNVTIRASEIEKIKMRTAEVNLNVRAALKELELLAEIEPGSRARIYVTNGDPVVEFSGYHLFGYRPLSPRGECWDGPFENLEMQRRVFHAFGYQTKACLLDADEDGNERETEAGE